MGCGGSSEKKSGGSGHDPRDPPSEASNAVDFEVSKEIHSAVRWNKPKEIKDFVYDEITANCRDNGEKNNGGTGNRPAHIAAQNGFLHLLKHLVHHGASINAQNHRGQTPMHMAVEYNYPKVVAYLKEQGADVHIKNKDGWEAQDGIEGTRNPLSPSYHMNGIQEAQTADELLAALQKAQTCTGELDTAMLAKFRLKSNKETPGLWSPECNEALKALIQSQREMLSSDE